MKEFNLIILDLMLPGISGEEFIEKLTNEKNTPILVASSKESIDSRVECLSLGADDYLVKPFDIKELKARVDALIRRSNMNNTNRNINYRGMVLNKELFDISIDGSLLNITRQEYKIIKLLLEKPKIEINLFV